MDISDAITACKGIKEHLKNFPKQRRHPLTTEWYPKKKLEEANNETLRKCIPFLTKIIKDIQVNLKEFKEDEYKSILARKEYIETKLEEAKKLRDAKRNQIINEIENCEALGSSKVAKIVIDEEKSKKIIDFLFENDINNTEVKFLENFIELTFDREANRKTEVYERILQLI